MKWRLFTEQPIMYMIIGDSKEIMKPKLQTYTIVQVDDELKLCCLKCGKILHSIIMCNHKVRSNDHIFKIDIVNKIGGR